MDTEQIKQLANDVNNVAMVAFQSGKERAESSLLAEIKELQGQIDLLEIIISSQKAQIKQLTSANLNPA